NVIYQLENLSDAKFGQGKKAELMAEAEFMRAFGHLFAMKEFAQFWDVSSKFGPLIRLEPSGIITNRKARSTVAEGYEVILEDLQFAIKYLPPFQSVYKVSVPLAKAYMVETLL